MAAEAVAAMPLAAAATRARCLPPQLAARRTAHAARCRAGGPQGASTSSSSSASASGTPMDVLRNDFSFLGEASGLDLLTPLDAVAGAHDEVCCVGVWRPRADRGCGICARLVHLLLVGPWRALANRCLPLRRASRRSWRCSTPLLASR